MRSAPQISVRAVVARERTAFQSIRAPYRRLGSMSTNDHNPPGGTTGRLPHSSAPRPNRCPTRRGTRCGPELGPVQRIGENHASATRWSLHAEVLCVPAAEFGLRLRLPSLSQQRELGDIKLGKIDVDHHGCDGVGERNRLLVRTLLAVRRQHLRAGGTDTASRSPAAPPDATAAPARIGCSSCRLPPPSPPNAPPASSHQATTPPVSRSRPRSCSPRSAASNGPGDRCGRLKGHQPQPRPQRRNRKVVQRHTSHLSDTLTAHGPRSFRPTANTTATPSCNLRSSARSTKLVSARKPRK